MEERDSHLDDKRIIDAVKVDAESNEEAITCGSKIQLCERCERIDFQTLGQFKQEDFVHRSQTLAKLGSSPGAVMPNNHCVICRILFQISEPGQFPRQRFSLVARSFHRYTTLLCDPTYPDSKHFAWDITYLETVSLTNEQKIRMNLLKRGALFCINNRVDAKALFQPRILNKKADLRVAKDWIDFCIQNHKSCGEPKGQLYGLKLIDCISRAVVLAPPNATYAALSYVWGSPKATTNLQLDHTPYSQTINDAIMVANGLGLQYLWVDQYCINQNDEIEKKQQIGQMGLIYSKAYITIIASAGNNSNCGLPGVGTTPREDQPVVHIDDLSIFSSMAHPCYTIRNSVWAGRGWTLQEAVLSRRRLFFTESQMYFECDKLCCSEALPHDLKLMSELSLSMNFGIFDDLPDQSSIRKKTTTDVFHQYHTLGIDYSRRKLTFDSDAANAFIGISIHFRNKGVDSFWGIGFERSNDHINWDTLCRSLGWKHVTSEDDLSLPCLRNFGKNEPFPSSSYGSIPSWSWQAWRGVVKDYDFLGFGATSRKVEKKFKAIKLEFLNRRMVELEALQEQLELYYETDAQLLYPIALHMEGRILDSTQFYCKSSDRFEGGSEITYDFWKRFKIIWSLSSWPEMPMLSESRIKASSLLSQSKMESLMLPPTNRVENLYQELTLGNVEMFLLSILDHDFTFLVTQKGEKCSYRIGVATVMSFNEQRMKDATIRLM